MKLSRHFTLREFVRSQVAARKDIDNTPDAEAIEAIKRLCTRVLDPVRKEFGPFSPSSGYRSPELNRAVKGARGSQHTLGQAADIEVPGLANVDLARWIRDNVSSFDQLILEFYDSNDPFAGWVHVSYVSPEDNRGEVLTAIRDVDEEGNRVTRYQEGLPTGRPYHPFA